MDRFEVDILRRGDRLGIVSCRHTFSLAVGIKGSGVGRPMSQLVNVIRLRNLNMKEKPTGLWRHVLHAPVHLYRWRLGFLMGSRFILIDHVGRKSGRPYQTPIEVVRHDPETGEYIVCSGTGPDADWYRNLSAHPTKAIQVKNRRWQPEQRLLSQQEASERFAGYEHDHPKAANRLLKTMGRGYDGTDDGRFAMMAKMPMIAFSDTQPDLSHQSQSLCQQLSVRHR